MESRELDLRPVEEREAESVLCKEQRAPGWAVAKSSFADGQPAGPLWPPLWAMAWDLAKLTGILRG